MNSSMAAVMLIQLAALTMFMLLIYKTGQRRPDYLSLWFYAWLGAAGMFILLFSHIMEVVTHVGY